MNPLFYVWFVIAVFLFAHTKSTYDAYDQEEKKRRYEEARWKRQQPKKIYSLSELVKPASEITAAAVIVVTAFVSIVFAGILMPMAFFLVEAPAPVVAWPRLLFGLTLVGIVLISTPIGYFSRLADPKLYLIEGAMTVSALLPAVWGLMGISASSTIFSVILTGSCFWIGAEAQNGRFGDDWATA